VTSRPRQEDPRFLTGGGRYLDDIDPLGGCHLALARMPAAHARIRAVELSAAAAAPGVLLVLTADDLREDGVTHVPVEVRPPGPSGGDPDWVPPAEPVLAGDRGRFVGEPVACVVAETAPQARDAAELIEIVYDDLPPVTDLRAAIGHPAVLHGAFPDNLLFDYEQGDRAAVEAAFARAARQVRLDFVNNRVYGGAMEPRGCIAAYELAAGRYTLTVGSPRPHNLQRALADHVFHLPRDRVRVVAVDTGGGFGPKNALYPEYILCLVAARRLGRSVKWLAERGESFCTDSQGRDNAFTAEAALDGDGRLLAIRVDRLVNIGAYAAPRTMVPTYNGLAHLTGVYDVPAAWVRVRGVVSNTTCTSVYRGAGRPETVTCCERLIDTAARVAGLDPVAFRRRNLIRPTAMPTTTALGLTYPVLDFEAVLDDALDRADEAGFADRRRRTEGAGRRRGFGLSLFVEELHGSPEPAPAAVFPDGDMICVAVATMSAGHGHETTFLQIAAEKMGLPVDRFRLVQGDTALVPDGIGTAASWSTVLGGSSVHLAAIAAIDHGREIAAGLMEVAAVDVEFNRGLFRVAGTDRTVGWDDVFAKAPDFRVDAVHDDQGQAFPTGCHVAEVEIDPATGIVDLVRFTAAADPGRMINPMIVAGQLHGGIAQGIGQAWTEGVVYDAESGQLLTGSFMDYCMPRAADLPAIDTAFRETPDPVNPLGAKGIGEAGATGATAAFVNAVIDALAPLGVAHIEMPLTPERVWHAIRDAERR